MTFLNPVVYSLPSGTSSAIVLTVGMVTAGLILALVAAVLVRHFRKAGTREKRRRASAPFTDLPASSDSDSAPVGPPRDGAAD